VSPVRLTGGTGPTTDLTGQPRMDDVFALNVFLHVAQLLRRVITIGTVELGGTGLPADFGLNASHHLGNVLDKL
jgi:hypothetical protein